MKKEIELKQLRKDQFLDQMKPKRVYFFDLSDGANFQEA